MLPKSNRMLQAAGIIILMFISTLKGVSQDSALVTETMYHKYEGNYKFPDGRFVTGGLMDEIKGHMVFLEPLNVSMGSIFKPVTETAFNLFRLTVSKSDLY